jgi:hypothetical protein
MHMLRKLSLWVASGAFRTLLFLLATVTAVIVVFGNPTHIKKALKTNNVYSSVVDTVLAEAKKSSENSKASDVPINDPAIKQAAKSAFSPAFLESSSEQFIDGTYHWLDGKTAQPDFQVDVGVAKLAFIKAIADYAEQRVNGLPSCGNQQLLQLQNTEINPFTLTCKPAGYNVASQKQTLINELNDAQEFLPNQKITADTLPKNESGETVFDQLEQAKQGYQFSKMSPAIVAILALLAGVAVFFLQTDRRKGARSLATSFLSVGLVLGVVSFAAAWGLHKLLGPTGSLGKTFQGNALQQSLALAIEQLVRVFTNKLLLFAVVYVVIGVALFCILRFWWKINKDEPAPEPKPVTEK